MNAWLSRCYGLRRLSFCKGNRNLWALHISWEVKCENSTGIGKSPLKHVQHTLQAYFLGDHCKVVVFDCILSTGAVCGLCFAATRWMEKGWNGNPWPPKSSRSVNSLFFLVSLQNWKKRHLRRQKKDGVMVQLPHLPSRKSSFGPAKAVFQMAALQLGGSPPPRSRRLSGSLCCSGGLDFGFFWGTSSRDWGAT